MIEGEPPAAVAPRSLRDRVDRIHPPAAVFAALVVVGLPVLLALGRYHWFLRDDWFFLTSRQVTVHDLFDPHNSHWSTVPILVFRTLFKLFGLRSYLPYQLVVVLLHLAVVVQLRIIMRRAGVGSWLATLSAGTFLLFGPGQEDIIWAFQVGFTGSVAFGLAHLLLADHEGPRDRRDVLGIAAGIVALMCSGVGITMALVVGLAVVVRRGWLAAAVNTVPLAVAYGVWWLAVRPELTDPFFGRPTIAVVLRWVRSGVTATFVALGAYRPLGVLLAVMLVVGVVAAVATASPGGSGDRFGPGAVGRLRLIGAPLALLAGSLAFMLMTSQGRWFAGPDAARASRYVYLGGMFTLPAVAVAAQAFVARWRLAAPLVAVALLVPVPAHVADFRDPVFGARYYATEQHVLRGVLRLPQVREVPRDVQPLPNAFNGRDVTVGFLLDAHDRGDLKALSGELSVALEQELLVRLGVSEQVVTTGVGTCRDYGRHVELHPAKGATFRLATGAPVQVQTKAGLAAGARPVTFEPGASAFDPGNGQQLTIELAGLDLVFAPADGSRAGVVFCRAAS